MKTITKKRAFIASIGLGLLSSSFVLAQEEESAAEASVPLPGQGACISSREEAEKLSIKEIIKRCGGGKVDDTKANVQNDFESVKPWWWSTRYEDLRDCGYHPQRKELTCVIDIKQRFRFGGSPPYNNPTTSGHGHGSHEHVQFCVQYNNRPWQYVAASAVHVHDLHQSHSNEAAAKKPVWRYTVTIQADDDAIPSATYPLQTGTPFGTTFFGNGYNGQTLKVRAHLSWYWRVPVNRFCQSRSTAWPWQDSSETFQIKLDP